MCSSPVILAHILAQPLTNCNIFCLFSGSNLSKGREMLVLMWGQSENSYFLISKAMAFYLKS